MRKLGPLVSATLVASCLLASTAPSGSAAAACNPGVIGSVPPQGCPHPGGDPSRALPSPSSGAPGVVAAGFHFRWDECARVSRWAPAHHRTLHGADVEFFWVWFEDGRAPFPMVLVCGRPATVAGFSRGPGATGASLPCPVVALGSQARRTRPAAAGWWVSSRAGYTNTGGGFGHNRDGFWNYRFYNPHADSVRARLFGACRMPPPGHS